MMVETAGWGTDWLPGRVRRRAVLDDAREARAEREAEAEREQLAEERHSRAMALYCQQAELRGEEISAVALATGQVSGRSISDILAAAIAAADREDLVTAARLHQQGHGEPEKLHVEFGEPTILQARSETGRKIASRSRRWQEWQEKKRAAESARRAVEADRDLGLVDGGAFRRRSEPAAVLTAGSERAGGPVLGDTGLRVRYGGSIVGVR